MSTPSILTSTFPFAETIDQLQTAMRSFNRVETKRILKTIVQFLRDKVSSVRNASNPYKTKSTAGASVIKFCDQIEETLLAFLPHIQKFLKEKSSDATIDTALMLQVANIRAAYLKLEEQWKEFSKTLDAAILEEVNLSPSITRTPSEEDILRKRSATVNHTELLDAARLGKLDVLEKFLAFDFVDVNFQDSNGSSALHWAVRTGQLDCVKRLVRAPGIDLNIQDALGYTALHYAVSAGNHDVTLQLLVQRGCRLTMKDNKGRTVVDIAKNKEIRSLVKAFMPHKSKEEKEKEKQQAKKSSSSETSKGAIPKKPESTNSTTNSSTNTTNNSTNSNPSNSKGVIPRKPTKEKKDTVDLPMTEDEEQDLREQKEKEQKEKETQSSNSETQPPMQKKKSGLILNLVSSMRGSTDKDKEQQQQQSKEQLPSSPLIGQKSKAEEEMKHQQEAIKSSPQQPRAGIELPFSTSTSTRRRGRTELFDVPVNPPPQKEENDEEKK